MSPDARRRDAKEQSRSAVGVSVCSARMRWRCSSAAATRHSTSAAVSAAADASAASSLGLAVWWRRQYRDIKKLIFLAPTTCPSDIIGSFANRTILKQLHARFYHSLKNGFSGTSLYALRRRPSSGTDTSTSQAITTPSQRPKSTRKSTMALLRKRARKKSRACAPFLAARAGLLCPV